MSDIYYDKTKELIVKRTLIEECAAGAVVNQLWRHTSALLSSMDMHHEQQLPAVPIANAPASIAEAVAGELLTTCHACAARPDCHIGHVQDMTGCDEIEPPPFAAAYHDAGGVRTYVLVSAVCGVCKGVDGSEINGGEPCPDCHGTGTTTDVGAIARRYGGDEDARVAEFRIKL